MNTAVPTRVVSSGGQYISDYSATTISITAHGGGTSTTTHSGTESGTSYVSRQTSSATGSNSARHYVTSNFTGAPYSFTVSLPNYYSGGTVRGSVNGTNIRLVDCYLDNVSNNKATVSYHLTSTSSIYRYVTVSATVSYTRSDGYGGRVTGQWEHSNVDVISAGPVTVNSGSATISSTNSSGYALSVSGASSNRISYSFPFRYNTSTVNPTVYYGTGYVTGIPSYASTHPPTTNFGRITDSDRDYDNNRYFVNVSASSSGTAYVRVNYGYTTAITNTTYANARFTGQYANGASAVNAQVNYIYFNGERYP